VLAGRDHACPPPFSLDTDLLAIGVDALEVEVDELLGAQAGRIGQLEHASVAQVERRGGGDALEQGDHLLGLEDVR